MKTFENLKVKIVDSILINWLFEYDVTFREVFDDEYLEINFYNDQEGVKFIKIYREVEGLVNCAAPQYSAGETHEAVIVETYHRKKCWLALQYWTPEDIAKGTRRNEDRSLSVLLLKKTI